MFPPKSPWPVCAILAGLLSVTSSCPAARLVAHWKLNEPTSPFADTSGNGCSLVLDPSTAPSLAGPGIENKATQLNWQAVPGISTRLSATSGAVQTDSFGFSFWMNPVNLSPNSANLLAKEIATAVAGPDWARMAWGVHVAGDNGSGAAALELIVRGANRTQGDFFGNVFSTVSVPLNAGSNQWFHIAGGYDATTGRLTLWVNGSEAVSGNSGPGAHNSDGGALAVGSARNAGDFISFAGGAYMDDIQIYDGPLSAGDIAELYTHPDGRMAEASVSPRFPASLLTHWKLDEPAPPYADSGESGIPLQQDFGTTTPLTALGLVGGAAQINWQAAPGVSSRLYAFGLPLQADTFGFSFWINPVNLRANENLIGKEMPQTVAGAGFSRLSWQVQMGADDGSGTAPLEFIVRGSDRTQGDFFGNAISPERLPLSTDAKGWTHVTGGYDAVTGAISLFVNGKEARSHNSRPGASNADGSAFDIGSMRNGPDFAAFGSGADIDEVQLYNGPLSDYDTAFLYSNPGERITTPFAITNFSANPDGSATVTFNSHYRWNYAIEASANLDTYTWVANVKGAGGQSTTVVLSKAELDAALGTAPRSTFFVRVRGVLEDPDASDLTNISPAEIRPFGNQEKYIPQFHYSLNRIDSGVGDPSGCLRFRNTYHLFTWDHAVSEDLVHWSAAGWPMADGTPDSGYWTGSVVVDLLNSGNFGTLENPAMAAIYTAHNNTTDKEDIRLASSTDYRNFHAYPGNPIVSTNDQVFRDPEVFWHELSGKWVMVVARSVERKLQFYSSSNLKNWELKSEFGPLGARDEMWEVPGLAELPIKDAQNRGRWVLFCGMGPNKTQYFVGDFDGSTFFVDGATQAFLSQGTGLEGTVIADFERPGYWESGWEVSGEAFGWTPEVSGTPVTGYLGQRLANSYIDGDWRTGTLLSPPFTLTKNCLNFLVAGGNHPGETCVNLLVNGQVVRSTTGSDSNIMKWAGWDVSQWKGQSARIQIVDNHTGFWGRIYVDHIMASDMLTNTGREHANWADWGSDFYGARLFRDYDDGGRASTWIGWMGNWQYAREIPAPQTWGKGTLSLPRRVTLEFSPRGYQLVQKPIPALQKLRSPVATASPRNIDGTESLPEFQPTANTCEIEASFNLSAPDQNFGVNLCVGNGHKVVVGYDAATKNIYLDRRASGNVSFHPAFPNIVASPYTPKGSSITLRIFVDQCSIEVFADDGRAVLSSLIFPDPENRGIELFSTRGTTALCSFRAWQLASIWQ